MPASIDVELVLRTIDDATRDWKQKFQTTTNELLEDIGQLFYSCVQALSELSIATDDNEKSKEDRLNAECIVSKLKELRHSLGDIWPDSMDSFGRDTFNVDTYRVEAAEFFQPIPFYPNDDFIMKLYRWSVYNTDGIVIYRYYLERSEMIPGQPYYVLGRSESSGHAQIQPYGTTIPDYNQMKIHVIDDLKGQGPSPIISLVYPSSNN
ncbi:unnamed protein product [Adineta steineri]|uniref:Uncharacterized protein n=2 Tax=Adineta steineri TaxID=433720 RepID=A0A814SE12_9BILA|nr:unnamed protein product [Adineta steineri]